MVVSGSVFWPIKSCLRNVAELEQPTGFLGLGGSGRQPDRVEFHSRPLPTRPGVRPSEGKHLQDTATVTGINCLLSRLPLSLLRTKLLPSYNRRKDCRSPKMSGLFGGPSSSAATSNTVGDLKQDVEVQQPPTDGVTDLSFNPNQSSQQDFLTVASWDKKVRLYEVTPQGQAQPRHAYDHEGPVFSVDWFKVGAHCPAGPLLLPGCGLQCHISDSL